MKRYGIDLRNHFIPLYSAFVFWVMLIAIVAWFEFAMDAIVIFGIVFLLDFLPTLYLHLQYWRKNRKEEYVVTRNEIIRYTAGGEETYNIDDIEKYIVYKSASMDKGGMTFFTVERYYYARLLLRSGDEMIITSLLMPKMDEVFGQLKGVEIERKKRGFCTL